MYCCVNLSDLEQVLKLKIFLLYKLCHFSSWVSDHTGSSDENEKQLNASDAQHVQYNHNSLNFQNFKLEKYIKIFPWLNYHSVQKGCKCKTCELLPLVISGGRSRHKFGKVAVKSLTDHPKHLLCGHETSQKHINAVKELASISSFSIPFLLSGFLVPVNATRH